MAVYQYFLINVDNSSTFTRAKNRNDSDDTLPYVIVEPFSPLG